MKTQKSEKTEQKSRKFLMPLLFLALLISQLQKESQGAGGVAAAEKKTVAAVHSVRSVEKRAIRTLAENLDVRHVRNSSYHLDDAASYYHGKQSRLIRALKTERSGV